MGASQGLERPGKEAYRLPPFPYVFMIWRLIKYRGDFNFCLKVGIPQLLKD
jgi:hypothetical protein